MKKLKRFHVYTFLIVACFFAKQQLNAKLLLPKLIGDNMVLQQKTKVKIWGEADANSIVSINASWLKKDATVKADSNGKWITDIKTPVAGGPYYMTISNADETIKIGNVLIGEVWFCSGQSNMEFPLGKTQKYWHTGVFDYERHVAKADYPNIHFFTVTKKTSTIPLDTVGGEWEVCTPVTVNDFSAVAYFFARKLYLSINIPIGLIHSSWGGTPAESWTRRSAIVNDSTYKRIFEREAKVLRDYDPNVYNEYVRKTAEWKKGVDNGTITGKAAKRGPGEPWGPLHSKMPGVLYNGMVAPVIPYTIKGAIWYQGESNNDDTEVYKSLFPAMINNWRYDWKQGDFPFYFVQIASHYRMKPELREAQLETLNKVKNTGIAVSLDVGDEKDIHPRNKQPVGERLALWALANDYGMKVNEYSGPMLKKVQVENDKMVLSFTHVGGGLVAKNDSLNLFEIAGADKKFVKAEAVIKGKKIEVMAPEVKKPVYVRYAWSNYMIPDLFNKEGLPASSFRNKK